MTVGAKAAARIPSCNKRNTKEELAKPGKRKGMRKIPKMKRNSETLNVSGIKVESREATICLPGAYMLDVSEYRTDAVLQNERE